MKLSLNKRELTFMSLRSRGLSEKGIARELKMTEAAVSGVLRRARDKNKIRDTLQLCVEAAREGLI